MGSRERPETKDARSISPSLWMHHLGEPGAGRSGCNQPTAETAIEVEGARLMKANLMLN